MAPVLFLKNYPKLPDEERWMDCDWGCATRSCLYIVQIFSVWLLFFFFKRKRRSSDSYSNWLYDRGGELLLDDAAIIIFILLHLPSHYWFMDFSKRLWPGFSQSFFVNRLCSNILDIFRRINSIWSQSKILITTELLNGLLSGISRTSSPFTPIQQNSEGAGKETKTLGVVCL